MRSAARGLLGGGGIVLAGVALVVVLLLIFGNGTADPIREDRHALACTLQLGGELPAQVHESSGLARGIRDPGLFWTHNDSGGDPVLFALGGDGRLAGAVRVEGARLEDWEDIEAAPCRSGGGPCLFIADTGDNDAQRDYVTIYEVREPAAGQAAVAARPIRLRYPGGARDAEGLFVVDGALHIVTKGREGPIRVYRVPAGAGGDGVATLEPVAEVAPRPQSTADYLTAATATPDGRWVAMRTYRTLLVMPAAPLVAGEPAEAHRFDLQPLGEAQGEGLAMDDEGGVWLTSEARGGAPPRWNRLVCELPEG
ncbi:MAG TPA: hypothetical protein VMM12_02000 [Longimicrobiales bacterium]|nr:hypothetical protein [Longimicrobiales bacterium]